MFYAADAISIQDLITQVVQRHTWFCPSVHSQMPLAQGAMCACTCVAPARSKTVAVRRGMLEGWNIVKRVWGEAELCGSSRHAEPIKREEEIKPIGGIKRPDNLGLIQRRQSVVIVFCSDA